MQRVTLEKHQNKIPTMGKLVGGVGVCFTGMIAGYSVMPDIPAMLKGAQYMPLVAGSFGLLIGWRVLGRLQRASVWRSAQFGVIAALYMVFMALAYLGVTEMIRLMMHMQYKSLAEALTDIVAQGFQFGISLAHPKVFVTILVGGAISGIFAALAERRWH